MSTLIIFALIGTTMISKYMDHAFFTLLPALVQIEELIGGGFASKVKRSMLDRVGTGSGSDLVNHGNQNR